MALGLYGAPVRTVSVLQDVRVLAQWMLKAADLTALDGILSTLDAPVLDAQATHTPAEPDRFTQRAGIHPVAVDMAVGCTLAMAVLDSPSPCAAEELLSRVMSVVHPEWALRLVRGRGRTLLSDYASTALVSAFNGVFRARSGPIALDTR
ncbi:hypothetical protein V4U86_21730 [Mycobacterium sp. AMU20-3851]|uniref:hypothetical protein n=1 Tax=Mycobacterium sp. AMU20-3851 TaxID=3122055 RepID=UPI00375441DA